MQHSKLIGLLTLVAGALRGIPKDVRICSYTGIKFVSDRCWDVQSVQERYSVSVYVTRGKYGPSRYIVVS